MAILKPCPMCKRLIPRGLAYCEDCAPIAEARRAEAAARRAEYKAKQYNKTYNAKRDPKYQQFYRSKAWKATSKAKLQAVGYKCEARLEHCQGLACEVHHKIAIQRPDGWDKRLDWDNLEAVCTSCHNGRHPGRFRGRQDDGVIDLRTVRR